MAKIDRYISTLPSDTQEIFEDAGADLNFGLRMSKAIIAGVQRDERGNDKTVFNFYRSGKGGDGAEGTRFALPNFEGVPFVELARRQKVLAEAYPQRLRLDLELHGRLVIGMGQASVYDNGITLHPVFGCPYLPGSSLKGVTRRTYIDEYHGGQEADALADKDFCDLFGCTGETLLERTDSDGNLVFRSKGKPETIPVKSFYNNNKDLGDRRGRLIFFDVLPTSAPRIVVDIVNPHYVPYYKDAKVPADIYNPIPSNFLAVEGGEFSVVVVADRPREGQAATLEAALFAKVEAALHLALTEDGIGGKTTVGYGRFVDPAQAKAKAAQAQQARLEAQAEAHALEKAAADEKLRQELSSSSEETWVPLSEVKVRKGVHTTNATVISYDDRKVVFQPLISELRGKTSKAEFSVKPFTPGLIVEIQITSIGKDFKGGYNLVKTSIQ